MKVHVRPRIQKDKWSLYWRTSMSTVTEKLEDIQIDADPGMSVEDFQAKVAEAMGWEPVDMLLRLEGFVEPWELAMTNGRELAKGKTIQDCGVNASDPVIFVRKVLVAEGWRIVTGADDDDDSEDEDGDW